jgi:PhoH-like ATPase
MLAKLVYVRNNIEVKDSKPIGHLPGTANEKLMPFAMPLADHIGGADALELMINQGKIEIIHFGQIRGRDLKNSIIMCSEVENMTKEHIQLLIGRVGVGSVLWLDGDVKQVDMEVFRQNSGMQIALERLRGHRRFGYVKLLKTERSETAAMADLLD